MDRERRAPALSSRSVLVSVAVAFAALSLPACRNKQEEARQKAELTKALEQYKAQIGEHLKQASALRARFEKLPEDMQGVGPLRDDLHAIEEVLGVEDGRTKWLSGKLEEAFASGKGKKETKAEVEAVRNGIPPGDEATAQAILKLTHQLLPFERLAAQRRYFEALDAENAQQAQKSAAQDSPKQPRPKRSTAGK
jgi:hypothetical protein